MRIKAVSIGIILFVIGLFLAFSLILLYITWPISETTIAQSGIFGDSFGPLTSLFSGLAFAGVIITILLQKEQLEEQRNEIAKGTKLAALTALLNTSKAQLTEVQRDIESRSQVPNSIAEKEKELLSKIDTLTKALEEILEKSGIKL